MTVTATAEKHHVSKDYVITKHNYMATHHFGNTQVLNLFSHLFTLTAPAPHKDVFFPSGDLVVQFLQQNVYASCTVNEPPHMVCHGGATRRRGT